MGENRASPAPSVEPEAASDRLALSRHRHRHLGHSEFSSQSMQVSDHQVQSNMDTEATSAVARTAHVSLKTLSEALSPKAVRFDGKTFSDLKQRLASAGFPGYTKDSFVQILDESQQFVCILDDDVLPPGDLFVEVHDYSKGLNQQKPSAADYPTLPPPFHYPAFPAFLSPLLQPQEFPRLGKHGHHHGHKKGNNLHKEAQREGSPPRFKHHHHDKFGGEKTNDHRPPHHGHHPEHDGPYHEHEGGRSHGHHHGHHLRHEGHSSEHEDGRLHKPHHHGHHSRHEGHRSEHEDGRLHGRHHHEDHYPEHGYQEAPAFGTDHGYHHGHKHHGKRKCDPPRDFSPSSRRGPGPRHHMNLDELIAYRMRMMQMRLERNAAEAADMHGIYAGEERRRYPRNPVYTSNREDSLGMRGRCHRWESPRHCRMKGPRGHPFHHRGRSHSPPDRKLGREQRIHQEEDLVPGFDKMTLDRHGNEGTAVNPASQKDEASSSRAEPVTYAFAEQDGDLAPVLCEDWIDADFVHEE